MKRFSKRFCCVVNSKYIQHWNAFNEIYFCFYFSISNNCTEHSAQSTIRTIRSAQYVQVLFDCTIYQFEIRFVLNIQYWNRQFTVHTEWVDLSNSVCFILFFLFFFIFFYTMWESLCMESRWTLSTKSMLFVEMLFIKVCLVRRYAPINILR